ncbi:MAG: class I SAM-dependent methyltransferase [Sporichthyaceae bacterium]|nr:class I SAM-dependent methyltransferase [Sporichthyaceae bacterium]
MLTTVRRQRFTVAVVGLALAVAIAAALGWYRVALIGLTGLLVIVALVLARIRTSLRDSRQHERELIRKRIDAASNRILAAVEGARLEVISRERAIQRSTLNQTREVEAMIQLFQRIKPRAPMPLSGRWALDPTGLLQLVSLIEQHRPALVVELGSGTSTVWLGYALEKAGGGRLISLDHQPAFAEQTRNVVEIHGLDKLVEVRDAPLTPLQLGDTESPWYSTDALDDLQAIDLLVVDGPPGHGRAADSLPGRAGTGRSAGRPGDRGARRRVPHRRDGDRATLVCRDSRPDPDYRHPRRPGDPDLPEVAHMPASRSAGILLYRRTGTGVEVLLAHMGGPLWARRDNRAWTVPKGEYDESEEPFAAAAREFAEELGVPAPTGAPVELGEVRQSGGKLVTVWAIEADLDPDSIVPGTFAMEWPKGSGQVREFPEIDRVAWLAPEAATAKVIAAQQVFLDRLLERLAG